MSKDSERDLEVSFGSVKLNKPKSFQEATSGPNLDKWRGPIDEELETHEVNKTWELVP